MKNAALCCGLSSPQFCKPLVIDAGHALLFGSSDHALPVGRGDTTPAPHLSGSLVTASGVIGELSNRLPPPDEIGHRGGY